MLACDSDVHLCSTHASIRPNHQHSDLGNRSRLIEELQSNANWVFASYKVELRLLAESVAEKSSAFASSLQLPVIAFDEVLNAANRARIAESA